jgi:hypothetical protein
MVCRLFTVGLFVFRELRLSHCDVSSHFHEWWGFNRRSAARLDKAGGSKKRRTTMLAPALRLYFAWFVAEREGAVVAEQHGFRHLLRRSAFLFQHLR